VPAPDDVVVLVVGRYHCVAVDYAATGDVAIVVGNILTSYIESECVRV
jgi:hypothetical protein